MNKATPVQMRKCLQVVEMLKTVGLRFVPLPVFDDTDNDALAEELRSRLEKIEQMCEEE